MAPPQNATVVLGHPAVMECMAQGQPKPLVSWSRQGNTGKLSYSFLSLSLAYCFCTLLHLSFIISASLAVYLPNTHKEQTSASEDEICSSCRCKVGVPLILAVSFQLLYPALSHALHKVICHINSFTPPPFVHSHPYTHMKC